MIIIANLSNLLVRGESSFVGDVHAEHINTYYCNAETSVATYLSATNLSATNMNVDNITC